MPDISADAMYENAAEKGTIDAIPEIPRSHRLVAKVASFCAAGLSRQVIHRKKET